MPKHGQSRYMLIQFCRRTWQVPVARPTNSLRISVKATEDHKQTECSGIGELAVSHRRGRISFQPSTTRPSTSADHPTPWLRNCPLERPGLPASPRGPLLVLSRRSFPVAPSPQPRKPRPRNHSSPDGRTLRRAQRRLSAFGCTLNALHSM